MCIKNIQHDQWSPIPLSRFFLLNQTHVTSEGSDGRNEDFWNPESFALQNASLFWCSQNTTGWRHLLVKTVWMQRKSSIMTPFTNHLQMFQEYLLNVTYK